MEGATASRYINMQKPGQRELCRKLRSLILRTFPGIREEMKMGVPWYGGKYYIAAFKDHVNLGFSIEGLSEKDLASFEGKGRYMRHVSLFPGKGMDEGRITVLLKIANKSRCSCP